MKKIMMICSIFMIALLAACGDIDEKNSRQVKSNSGGAADVQEDATEEVEEEVEEKEKPVGTRSNPLPFGDTITVKENIYDDSFNSYESLVKATFLETISGKEVWSLIQEEHEFNEPAVESSEIQKV